MSSYVRCDLKRQQKPALPRGDSLSHVSEASGPGCGGHRRPVEPDVVSAENQPLVEEVSLPFFQLKVPSAMEPQGKDGWFSC